MACGLKKQNTNEGGVHLTERTCSPYNPIIKLIVDDCLGLPIYPVTSVDAVIDEEGNTLRKVLETLLDNINSGNSDVSTEIQKIYDTLEELGSNQNNEEVQLLKALVWAISSMAHLDPEHHLYTNNIPTIVAKVMELQNLIGLGGNISERLNTLEEILLAVANFDDEYLLNNKQIEIIKTILEIQAELGASGGDPTPNQNGTLREKVAWLMQLLLDLYDRILGLEKNSAHLDPRVLEQMPDNVLSNREIYYKSLKISEYPPTTAKFVKASSIDTTGMIYFGFLKPVVVTEGFIDTYPFGHTNQEVGYPLSYYDRTTQQYIDIKTTDNLNVRIGDGIIDGRDIVQEINFALMIANNPSVKFETEQSTNMPDGVTLDDVYVKVETNGITTYVHVGNCNSDGEVTISDVNALISEYINRTMTTSPQSTYSSNYAVGWISYITQDFIVQYPCIEGKIYVDELTGEAYRYTKGKMYPVSKHKIKAGAGIIVEEGRDFENDEDLLGPYKTTTVSLNVTPGTAYYCGTPLEIEDVPIGQLYIYTGTRNVVRLGFTIDNDSSPTFIRTKKYNVEGITKLINGLLQFSKKLISSGLTGTNYYRDTVNDLLEIKEYVSTYPDPTAELQEIIDDLLAAFNEIIPPETFPFNGHIIDDSDDSLNVEPIVTPLGDRPIFLPPLPSGKETASSNTFVQGTNDAPVLYLYDYDALMSYLDNNEFNESYVSDPENGIKIPITLEDMAYNYHKVFDFAGDGLAGITDVTTLINAMLSGQEEALRIKQATVELGRALYIKTEVTDIENPNTWTKVENKAGAVVKSSDGDMWYLEDNAGVVKRFPEYSLQVAYNPSSNKPSHIYLFKDDSPISEVDLSALMDTSNDNSTQEDNTISDNTGE